MPAPFLIRTVGIQRFLINADDHYRAVGGGRASVQRVAERHIRPVKKTRSRQELACIVPSVFIRYMVAATAFPQPQADSSRDSVMFFHADLKYMTVSYWHHFITGHRGLQEGFRAGARKKAANGFWSGRFHSEYMRRAP